MTKARFEQISLEDTPFYHCYARCVRRTFLCGVDKETGENFEHRKGWIVDRMKQLASVFCMDICAYAVMDNHYHIVLRVDEEEARGLSVEAVLLRWNTLFSGNYLVTRYLSTDRGSMTDAEIDKVREIAEEWCNRLTEISWFMRCLNEYIARMANKEDGCKGRFWEGRFKSQALLDEVAVLACMTYVDLNPVRAGLANTPESSDYTAIQERISNYHVSEEMISQSGNPPPLPDKPQCIEQTNKIPENTHDCPPKPLLDFIGDEHIDQPKGIAYSLNDYLDLVDWTGRAIINGKRGAIPEHLPPILRRLQVNPGQWVVTVKHFNRRFPRMAGKIDRLMTIYQKLDLSWSHGLRESQLLYL